MEMRVFCGYDICFDENNINEEHVIFPALADSPFLLIDSDTNKYSSCLGYFFQCFNSKDECPKTDDGESVCKYSDFIRIKYYGGTNKTKSEARCGLQAVDNVIYFPFFPIEPPAAKVFDELIKHFSRMGFTEGFS